jgi:thiol-disulfide isomerase/thioredoxin
MRKIISLLLVGLLLSGCTTKLQDYNNSVVSALPQANMSEYTRLSDGSHMFREGTFKLLKEQFTAKQMLVVYIGFPGCPWCQEAIPFLNSVSKEYEVPVVTLDLSKMVTDEYYQDFFVSFADQLTDDGQGGKQLSVPLVLFIKDQKVVTSHLATVNTHNAHERLMTPDEEAQLTKIYQDAFKKLLAE